MKDCNVCTVCNSENDPIYYVFLCSIVDGFTDVVDLYTFSSQEKLVDFLLSIDFGSFSIADIGSVSGHDFAYHWDV